MGDVRLQELQETPSRKPELGAVRRLLRLVPHLLHPRQGDQLRRRRALLVRVQDRDEEEAPAEEQVRESSGIDYLLKFIKTGTFSTGFPHRCKCQG